jgi:AcrR family transcriptional regulator
MSQASMFGREPADTHEAIMFATYAALQKHGYAGLSIQRIADESDLSKSTFYHHFDGKDDILLSFAEFLLVACENIFQQESTGDPREDLRIYLAVLTAEWDTGPPDSQTDALLRTYMEVRSQAIRDERYREKITGTIESRNEQVVSLLEQGIDQGVFRDVDPERTANVLLSMVSGTIHEKITRTDDPAPDLLEQIFEYIDEQIVADRTA